MLSCFLFELQDNQNRSNELSGLSYWWYIQYFSPERLPLVQVVNLTDEGSYFSCSVCVSMVGLLAKLQLCLSQYFIEVRVGSSRVLRYLVDQFLIYDRHLA